MTRQLILLRFQVGRFFICLFLAHIVTAEIVRWHFLLFTYYLTLPGLPPIYTTYQDHVAQLAFWQVPFDSVVVGLFSFSLFYNYLLYTVGFKVFKDLFTLKIDQIKLEQENTQLEFNFLKAQINPHFLFNTLNNIYSFSIKSPERVSSTILKLAELMRYSLYETETERVLLVKELTFIDSYVQLQRIRHEVGVHIVYKVEGNPGTLTIPPMLLIVFVENAFKHGLQASTQTGWVNILLKIENQQIVFTIENSRPLQQTMETGGIGLTNVQKRLYHFFAGRHQLAFNKTATVFGVHLIINLHE